MGTPDLPPGSACNGKIDLLFVVTQDGHFVNYVEALYDSYPEILATIQEEFADFDLHVMFADPNDRWAANNACPKGMCPEEGGCPTKGYEDFPCWVFYDEEALTKCDNKVGAGVVFPAGNSASNQPCDLPEGQRYLEGDDPLFAERFECISHTGIGGSTSMPGWAVGEAVSLDLQEGCNAGFFRDDALLFAVVVSTHDYSAYNPYVWAQRVLEAKEYEQDMIVALGFGVGGDGAPDPWCEGGDEGEPGTTFQWTQEFEHNAWDSICGPSFAPAFAEAATMAAELCANGSQN